MGAWRREDLLGIAAQYYRGSVSAGAIAGLSTPQLEAIASVYGVFQAQQVANRERQAAAIQRLAASDPFSPAQRAAYTTGRAMEGAGVSALKPELRRPLIADAVSEGEEGDLGTRDDEESDEW